MSMSKNVWVFEVWNPVGDGDGWTPLFARAFNDWEIDLVERLLQKIHAFGGALLRVPPKVAFFAWEASWVKATFLGWNGWFVGKRSKRAWQMAPLCIFWGSLVESHSSLVNCSINVDEILLLLSGIEGTPLVVLTQGDLEEVNNLSKSTPEVKSFGTGIEVKFFQVALCPNPCFQLRSTNCK
ncbi:hypothetical protein CK203_027238 [Vitis vinifera]|uniref:Reverse transcriptase zinc-binding domain-containing protein n=1 Tax=Vitis vinifera TaxID=29760 RepID=A0A438J9R6_VITVI|nr:hypothetical protein CK203_027238 [Vitis vinifera]